jgi:fructose-1,6-bisphosphatase/inositol monophosphatase family enzyme
MAAGPDIDAVTSRLHECAETLMLPRFRRLGADDVERKANPADPDDLVTIVDRAVEARLTSALRDLAPGSIVVGEESAHADPRLLEVVGTDQPYWLLDPLDGTRNFVRGDPGFGLIVAWVAGGGVRAAWIVLPARQETFVAAARSGVFKNGVRVRVPAETPPEPWRGSVYVRYMPARVAEDVTRAAAGRFEPTAESGCAAVEYTHVLEGRREFALYYRLLPWDHAAPAFILEEAGGRVEHEGGRRYRVDSANQVTVVARDRQVAEQVRAWLSGRRRALQT